MIHYRRGGIYHVINLFQVRGSTFPFSCGVAFPCAALCGILKWFELVADNDVLTNNTMWSGFSFLVGFLVVFRTSQAYSRFWDGATAVHRMRAEWLDAASAMFAFCKHSKAEPDLIMKFQHTLARLFSILHAMALGEIEECVEGQEARCLLLELIDPEGLDDQSWEFLNECSNKANLVFSWIQVLIVDNINTGVMSIPPPILSRVFQELANGMVVLHDAEKIAEVPLPFPYTQTCDLVLILHWLLTPLISAQWSNNPWWASAFAFIQVFTFWSLNAIATEIEHPFGKNRNDLEPEAMQLKMNEQLLLLLHPAANKAPELSEDAILGDHLAVLGKESRIDEDRVHSTVSYKAVLSDVARRNTICHNSDYNMDSESLTGRISHCSESVESDSEPLGVLSGIGQSFCSEQSAVEEPSATGGSGALGGDIGAMDASPSTPSRAASGLNLPSRISTASAVRRTSTAAYDRERSSEVPEKTMRQLYVVGPGTRPSNKDRAKQPSIIKTGETLRTSAIMNSTSSGSWARESREYLSERYPRNSSIMNSTSSGAFASASREYIEDASYRDPEHRKYGVTRSGSRARSITSREAHSRREQASYAPTDHAESHLEKEEDDEAPQSASEHLAEQLSRGPHSADELVVPSSVVI